jgi:hypothetical protein
MSRIYSKPVVSFLPLLFLLCPSCRVVPRGVPGAEYAVIRVQDGKYMGVEAKRITAYQNPNPKPPVKRRAPPLDKAHPIIDRWIKDPAIPDGQLEDVLIGLLPPANSADPKTYLQAFERDHKLYGESIKHYDSIYTLSVKLPVGALRGQLSRDKRIRYIEPKRVPLSLAMFPTRDDACKGLAGYASLDPSVKKIRELAVTTGLASFAVPQEARIALLDSGVGTHLQLPESQLVRHDCLLSPSCSTGPGTGSDGCGNHGTPDAGILIANGSGSEPHGLLQPDDVSLAGATVHSFKVADQSGTAGNCSADGDATATVAALTLGIGAVSPKVDVILTETLIPGEANSSVSMAVDRAFDDGYPVIVAANPTETLWSPSNAHKGFPVASTAQSDSYATDGRSVPAVWAESSSETLSSISSNYCMHDGASGAAPYAAAVAVKLRHLLKSSGKPDDPGNVYALILALSKSDFFFSRLLYLPSDGQYYTGSFDIKHGGEAYATVNVTAGQKLRAAIWWPESAATDTGAEVHNEIYLEIGKPDGLSAGKAAEKQSVFQYQTVELTIPPGDWIIKVTGANVAPEANGAPGHQFVYWAAFTGP